MIRVGIIGAGGIARVHANCYRQLANAQVVAIADVRAEAAAALATEHGAAAYPTAEALLSGSAVDMVDVCVPTHAHVESVVAAAQAGRHILCEKPIALSLAGVERMIEAVRRAGVWAMVAQVCRFMPHYRLIKEYLERGDLGRTLMAQAARLATAPTWGSWYMDPDLGGGALFDLHIHDLDYLYSIFGKPRQVYAIGVASENGAWNEVHTSLDYGQFKATADGSFLMPPGSPFTTLFRLLGEKGSVHYPYRTQAQVDPKAAATAQGDLAVFLNGQPVHCPPLSARDPYLVEIEYFVDCLAAGREPAIATLAEARDVLQIALAARASMETGRVVPFPHRNISSS